MCRIGDSVLTLPGESVGLGLGLVLGLGSKLGLVLRLGLGLGLRLRLRLGLGLATYQWIRLNWLSPHKKPFLDQNMSNGSLPRAIKS